MNSETKATGVMYLRLEGIPLVLIYEEGVDVIYYASILTPNSWYFSSSKSLRDSWDVFTKIKYDLVSCLSSLSSYISLTEGFIKGNYNIKDYRDKARPLVCK